MRAAGHRQEHAIHGVLWSAKKDEKREAFSRHREEHAIHGVLWSAKKDEREKPLKGVHRGLQSGRPHGVVWVMVSVEV